MLVLAQPFLGSFVRPSVQSFVRSLVSVYYVAVRTIVLSRHGSNLTRPVIIHDIIHSLIYVPSTPYCAFSAVSPDGNWAYVHWGSFTSNSQSDKPSDLRGSLSPTSVYQVQHLAVKGGHPFNYEPGATLLNPLKPTGKFFASDVFVWRRNKKNILKGYTTWTRFKVPCRLG